MKTLTDYCLEQFGEKLYKLSLSAPVSCPNRDGALDTRGCIFCSAGGSGDFAESAALPVEEQLERAKERVSGKFRGRRFIAYFQSYTGTYAPAETLEPIFTAAAKRDDIAAVSIATRPDCLPEEILRMLARLKKIKPVWIELGLQTTNEKTAEYIRRGYELSVYGRAAGRLREMGFHTISHVILGLPGESETDMLETVRYAAEKTDGIKLQLLHVLEGTDLARDWRAGRVPIMSMEEYVSLVCDCVSILPAETVVHRLTGDGPKRLLLAPEWSTDKKRVLNALSSELKARGLR